MVDDEPLSAEESLNLIAQQNRRMRRELGGARRASWRRGPSPG